MAITDPEIIRLSNETVRPLAEQVRNLGLMLLAIDADVQRVLPSVPNDAAEVVDDGREDEGVPRLTGADVHALEAIRQQILTQLTPEAQVVIARAAVRPPRVAGG
mgnify:FL=1